MRFPLAFERRTLGLAAALTIFSAGAIVAYSQGGPVAENERAYQEGLEMWRRADLGNNSCSFCHSFEGTELAVYNFDDETLRRRAEPHFGKAEAPKLVEFIHAVRKRYGLTRLHDPMKDRPLQPGGQPLPGDTPQTRDLAF